MWELIINRSHVCFCGLVNVWSSPHRSGVSPSIWLNRKQESCWCRCGIKAIMQGKNAWWNCPDLCADDRIMTLSCVSEHVLQHTLSRGTTHTVISRTHVAYLHLHRIWVSDRANSPSNASCPFTNIHDMWCEENTYYILLQHTVVVTVVNWLHCITLQVTSSSQMKNNL